MSKDRNLVLVVDDDPGMLRAVKRLLRQHDYEPILFSSAQAFKSHTDFEKAACVILDINLQRWIGDRAEAWSQSCRRFRARHLHHRERDPTVREAALASGCIAFLTKPFSAHELIEPLNSVAGLPKSGAQ